MHAHTSSSARRLCSYAAALLAATLLWPGVVRGQAPAAQEQVYVGDLLTLSAAGQNIKEALAVRAGIVRIEPIDDKNPTVVRVQALKIGSTRVILTTEAGAQIVYNIQVRPDLSAIRNAVTQEFPTANVTIHAGIAGQLIVSGTVHNPEDVDPLIRYVAAFLDGQSRNVINNLRVAGLSTIQLEVCLAGVTRSLARNLSFSFLTADQQNFFMNALPSSATAALTATVNRGTGNPAAAVGTFTSASTTNAIFSLTGTNAEFQGLLQALKQENVTKILANQSLTTLSGRPADFVVGGQAPYGTAGSGGGLGTGIQFKEFGTRIQFVPVIVADGKIRLDINAEVSNIDPALSFTGANVVAPGFDTRAIQATVELESGQTMAIGGLIQNNVTGTAVKVPIFGDLPFFGTFFRETRYNEIEQELLIIVTPRYVDPMDCAQMKSKLPGQETRSVTDFELFLEGILEAPRGPREICPDGTYRPAHWWTPNNGRCYPAGACGTTTGGALGTTPNVAAPLSNGRMAEVPSMPPNMKEMTPASMPAETNGKTQRSEEPGGVVPAAGSTSGRD